MTPPTGFGFDVRRAYVWRVLEALQEMAFVRIDVRIEPEWAYFKVRGETETTIFGALARKQIPFEATGDNHPTAVGR